MNLMNISDFNTPFEIQTLLKKIHEYCQTPMCIMEVCGTHTMSIFKHGIRSLLPSSLKLLSGPGCPVCVTPQSDMDRFILAARQKNVIIASFGDLFRVPANHSTLMNERSDGHDIRVVYSPMDALDLARNNQNKSIIFLAVGFETTAPAVAATIIMAQAENIQNFFILSAHRRVIPALELLITHPDTQIDGFILPGHVSTIIGESAYGHIPDKFNIGGVIAGFEAGDIVYAIYQLVLQILQKSPCIENAYLRAVNSEGNIKAKELMSKVFKVTDANWRGIGNIPNSGLVLKRAYASFDAVNRFELDVKKSNNPRGCQCGEVLMGLITPNQCQLYEKVCTPAYPVGPCMVSSEGTCAAYYRYARKI
ncbi:hydrogenase expression/formation protein HypD [Candidatus Magnetomorum sp. HK-1]|nr:hydrogenase expression/formation protein HypD [Candidatus Magnetomorum sp. HK-1]